MREHLTAVQALREQGWSWWRAALFTYAYGPRMTFRSVSALEGVRARNSDSRSV